MNCIYLNGHSYTPDDLRALIADRDNWQAEAERLRAADVLNREAIVLLVTENAKEPEPEALEALGEAMDTGMAQPVPEEPWTPAPGRRCEFVREDGRQCDGWLYPVGHMCWKSDDQHGHVYYCGKPIDGNGTCSELEGHDGPCKDIPF